jgi:Tfp pilus assembly protein PilN
MTSTAYIQTRRLKTLSKFGLFLSVSTNGITARDAQKMTTQVPITISSLHERVYSATTPEGDGERSEYAPIEAPHE